MNKPLYQDLMSIVTQPNQPQKPTFKLNPLASAKLALLVGATVSTVFVGLPNAQAQIQTQDQTQDQISNADIEQMPTVELPPIIVIARSVYADGQLATTNHVGLLGDKDFMETPFNTISYTDKFISDKQATDITDVIADSDPSVYSSGIAGQNLESYQIRGFASDIGDVTVDGLFGIAPYYRSSPEMFERIEVLKGPSALLNGMPPKGSVGGTVNLVPKRAGSKPLTQITARYLSDSQFGGHVDIGRRFGEDQQFGVRFNGVYRNGETAVHEQSKQAQLASLALDWQSEQARVSTDLYYSKDHVDGPTRGIMLAPNVAVPKPPKPDTLLNPNWAYNNSEDKGITARGEIDINEQLTAHVAVGGSKTNFQSQSASRATVINDAGDYTTQLGEVDDEVTRKSAEAGLTGKFATGDIEHQMAFNINGYDEDYQLNARFLKGMDVTTNIYNPKWPAFNVPLNTPALLNTKTRLVSYGLADTLSLAQDKLQVTLGVRQQQVKSEQSGLLASSADYDKSATTPAIAVLGKVNDNISVYGNYIEGLSKGANAPVDAKNAGEIFAPYKTKQKEVGVKVDLDNFTHTLSAYEIKRPNSYTDPVTNIFSFGGEQRNRGIEWGFTGSPIQDVRLMGGVAYVDAKMTKTAGGVNQDKQATGVPKWQAKLGAEWDVPAMPDLTLLANATAVSKQYVDASNTLTLPSRTIFDVGARYKTSMNNYPVTLRGTVSNVTNEAYWAKPHYLSLGLGEPRTFMMSATVDF